MSVESVAKKCAFLRTAARGMQLVNVHVHNARIEQIAPKIGPVDAVTARALAPLGQLLELSTPLRSPQTRCVFAKGQTFKQEMADASKHWRWAEETIVASAQGDGAIVVLSGIERL